MANLFWSVAIILALLCIVGLFLHLISLTVRCAMLLAVLFMIFIIVASRKKS
jgi:hypothetical protein